MIVVFVEHEAGRISDRSLEAIAFARALGSPLVAFAPGAGGNGIAAGLGEWGVSEVIVEPGDGSEYSAAGWAAGLVGTGSTPQAIVACGTDRGNEVMGYAAAMLGLPLAANCIASSGGDPLRVTRLRWGGSLLEDAVLDAPIKLLTVAPLSIEATPAASPVEVAVRPLPAAPAVPGARLVERVEPGRGGVRLADARVVVSGGRGVGSTEGFGLLEEVAGLLGAAVGCSRVATSEGWRPHADQVGLTGTRIAPDLYVACGISGAFQHMVGCKGAKHILAINKDPNAPIMQRADWAVIGDLFEVLPELAAAVRAAKGEPPA